MEETYSRTSFVWDGSGAPPVPFLMRTMRNEAGEAHMAKRLLMGNEAFAHAALEAGVRVVAGYPGTPSSELIEPVA